MFGWFKNRKTKKEIKEHLMELKKLLLEINLNANASAKEVEEFYQQIKIWEKILAEKSFELDKVIQLWSAKDRNDLVWHIDKCINNYGDTMIALNETLLNYLDAVNISHETKVGIANFGRENVNKSNATLNVLRNLVKHICMA